MKKIGIYITILFLGSFAMAQDLNDGLRFSQTELNGTARFRGLSGAFGALGGDLSAVSVNPAGSSVFANNQFVLTTTNFGVKNEGVYFGENSTAKTNNFSLNQIGGVFVFRIDDSNTKWKKFALCINYDKLNDFRADLSYKGLNPQRSIVDYFLYYGNHSKENITTPVPLELVSLQNNETVPELYQYLAQFPTNDYPGVNSFNAQQTLLGFQSYLLEPTFDGNNKFVNYISNVVPGSYKQAYGMQTKGYNGKLNINFSGQYGDMLYIGANLNPHFFDYTQTSVFEETNNNGVFNNGVTVDRIKFNNSLHSYGSGFSLQLGVICKIIKPLRLGLTYETPTWLKVNDELTQSIVTSGYGIDVNYKTVSVNPNVVNKYQPYSLSTPGKVTLSSAYVFGKQGLISLDYSYKDYSEMSFTPENDFSEVNKSINLGLQGVNELRAGAEYKIEKLSFRGGYRFESSPFVDTNKMGDLKGYSAGIGYNFGGTKIDLAYSTSKRNYQYQAFNRGFLDTAAIAKKNDNVTLSVAFEF